MAPAAAAAGAAAAAAASEAAAAAGTMALLPLYTANVTRFLERRFYRSLQEA